MTLTQSLLIDRETPSFVFPINGQGMVTEADRALHSGEAFIVGQEGKFPLVEGFHPDMEQVGFPVPVNDVD